MILILQAWVTGRIMVPSAVTGKKEGLGEGNDFCFGHLEFKMTMGHSV